MHGRFQAARFTSLIWFRITLSDARPGLTPVTGPAHRDKLSDACRNGPPYATGVFLCKFAEVDALSAGGRLFGFELFAQIGEGHADMLMHER